MEEEKMFCPNCGAEVPEGSVFCANGGASLLSAEQPQMNAQVDNTQSAPYQEPEIKGFDPNSAFSQTAEQQAPVAPGYQPQQDYQNGQYTQNTQYNQYGQYNQYQQQYHKDDALETVIKVFMILSCVVGAFACFIPLAWMVPMTVVTFKKIDKGESFGTALKVCTLLFVGIVPGILMFAYDSDKPKY